MQVYNSSDLLKLIFGFIPDIAGSEYKSICVVCKLWNVVIKQVYPIADVQLANHLATLMKLFPHKPWWIYRNLSSNYNTTTNMVLSTIDTMPWRFDSLSHWIPYEIISIYPDKPWSYKGLSCNPTITWEIVKSDIGKPWDRQGLSMNPCITWDHVKDNPGFGWDYAALCLNPNITPEIIRNNPNHNWSYDLLSHNPNMTWEFIGENLDKKWDYYSLSKNPELQQQRGMNIPGLYGSIAHKKINEVIYDPYEITLDDIFAEGPNADIRDIIDKHPEKMWYHIDNDPRLTIDIVLTYKNIPWDYTEVSSMADLTLDIVRANMHLPWSFNILADNPSIDMEGLILLYIDSKLVDIIRGLSSSQQLTWKHVYDHQDIAWNGKLLSHNNFGKQKRHPASLVSYYSRK